MTKAQTSRDRCISDSEIEMFLAHQLGRTEQDQLESHLDVCPACADRLSAAVAPELFWRESTAIFKSSASLAETTSEPSQFPLEVSLSPTDDPEMLGRIGGYEICGVIGRGGMGVVLKGWDRSLDRYVAIKVLQPTYAHQSMSRFRFAREARAAAGVVHDNVIAIFGVDEHNGLPYLVMPYIKGESLERRIERQAPLSLEEILEISLQISRGLEAAHQQGVVHRDIKPANILLPESVSRIVITDFGLATAIGETSLTRSHALVGTPSYMSPEQVRGDQLDGRSDLFSLGCTMYAMACGCPPFRATSAYSVLRKVTDEAQRPLHRLRPDLPRWLSDLVDKLLVKDPKFRVASATDLTSVLEDCLSHIRQPSLVRLPEAVGRPTTVGNWLTGQRMKSIVWLIGVALVILIFSFTILPTYLNPDNREDSASPIIATHPVSFDRVIHDQIEWLEFCKEMDRVENEVKTLIEEFDDEPK